jgi:hypothetical protein
MTEVASVDPSPAPAPASGTLREHFAARIDPLTSAILVFPLFLVYQLGILTSRGINGVDFVTTALVDLCERDLANYLVCLAAMLVGYAALLVLLRRGGRFSPGSFLGVLAESTFYALTMGTLIVFVMNEAIEFFPGLAAGGGAKRRSFVEIIVISAGAGLHEELVFRLVGLGGLAWLLTGVTGEKRAFVAALCISALTFSLAHHVGPHGEPFAFDAFVYRALAGVFFGVVYHARGLAVAVWSHALYDVYVFTSAAP